MTFVGRRWRLPGGLDNPTLILESLAGPACHGQRFPEGHRKSEVTLLKDEVTTETPLTSGRAHSPPRPCPVLVSTFSGFKDTWPCPPPDTGPATGTLHPTNEQVHVQLRRDYHHLVQLRKVKTPLAMSVFPLQCSLRSCGVPIAVHGSFCHLPSLKLCAGRRVGDESGLGRRGYPVSPAPWRTWQTL